MAVLRSLAFYAAFYGISALLVIFAALAIPFGRATVVPVAHFWSTWHRICVERLLGITIVIEGETPPGPALYAVKHESYFDAIDLPQYVPFPGVFAKQELFDIPLWGRAARVYGLIPVARQEGARALRAMLAAARERVAEGRSLAIFPEGTRVPHGERPPLRSGFAGIYKLIGIQVVPVAIASGPIYHRRWKRRGTITIRFGEVIPPGLPREEAEARVHAAINAFNAPVGG